MIDHVHDFNRKLLWQLAQLESIPEFVKRADLAQPTDLVDLPSDCFVDPSQRLFPVHTRADAWLSWKFLDKFASRFGYTLNTAQQRHLRDMLDYWKLKTAAGQDTPNVADPKEVAVKHEGEPEEDAEITLPKPKTGEVSGERMPKGYPAADYQVESEKTACAEVDELEEAALQRSKMPPKTPVAATPVEPDEDDEKKEASLVYHVNGRAQRIPVTNAETLQKFARYLLETPKDFSYSVRQEIAEQMLKLASCMHVRFSPEIEVGLQKTAGLGVGTLDSALMAVHYRQLALDKYPEYQKPLRELQTAMTKTAKEGLLDAEMLKTAAQVLDAVDRLNGLHQRYTPTFQPPERDLFQTTVRQWDDFARNAVSLPNGKYASREQLLHPRVKDFMSRSLGVSFKSDEELLQKAARQLSLRQSQMLWEMLQEAQVA